MAFHGSVVEHERPASLDGSTRPEWSRPRSQAPGAKWETRGGPIVALASGDFQIRSGWGSRNKKKPGSARERSHLPAHLPFPSSPPHPGDAAAPRPSNPTARERSRGTGRGRCRRRSAAMRRPPSSASSAPPPPSSSHVRSPSPSSPSHSRDQAAPYPKLRFFLRKA
jgi:hypothetical protein